MDATSGQNILERVRSSHDQCFWKFERATELLTGGVGPSLVATALKSAIDGQIALLHVVRASLAKIQGEEARLLSENLSDGQLQLTIYRELRSK